jgi:hypothetical protein
MTDNYLPDARSCFCEPPDVLDLKDILATTCAIRKRFIPPGLPYGQNVITSYTN